ncbi:MAG TPA: hypothetical protein VJH90_00300 [archaeon]|nr:hypothetical protein [archaeon]
MKGIFFTMTVAIVFLGIISYLVVFSNTNIQNYQSISDKVSAQRTFYYWKSVDSTLSNVLNVTIGKTNNTAEINDTLPAQFDINDQLEGLGKFIDSYYADPSIEIFFQDDAGNRMELTALQSKIVLQPFGINYTWQDFGKNVVKIESSPGSANAITNVMEVIRMKNVQFNCNTTTTTGPTRCNKWSPDSSVGSCSGIVHCLNLNLTFIDVNGTAFNYPENKFDIDRKSTTNLDVKNGTNAFSITIQVGELNTVLNIDLHNVQTDTNNKLILNTTEFTINYPAKLAVVTPYSRKIDWS